MDGAILGFYPRYGDDRVQEIDVDALNVDSFIVFVAKTFAPFCNPFSVYLLELLDYK